MKAAFEGRKLSDESTTFALCSEAFISILPEVHP